MAAYAGMTGKRASAKPENAGMSRVYATVGFQWAGGDRSPSWVAPDLIL